VLCRRGCAAEIWHCYLEELFLITSGNTAAQAYLCLVFRYYRRWLLDTEHDTSTAWRQYAALYHQCSTADTRSPLLLILHKLTKSRGYWNQAKKITWLLHLFVVVGVGAKVKSAGNWAEWPLPLARCYHSTHSPSTVRQRQQIQLTVVNSDEKKVIRIAKCDVFSGVCESIR